MTPEGYEGGGFDAADDRYLPWSAWPAIWLTRVRDDEWWFIGDGSCGVVTLDGVTYGSRAPVAVS